VPLILRIFTLILLKGFIILINRIIGQMHVQILQVVIRRPAVLFCAEADQPVLVDVDAEGIDTID